MTTKKSKRTYNAPKGTKITGVEMLNDGKVLLTFAEDEGEAKFKRGDIITNDINAIAIYSKRNNPNHNNFDAISGILTKANRNKIASGYEITNPNGFGTISNYRLATPTEQQVLFDALKKEGKRWNKEKLEIEDIKEEFKRGDILTAVGVGHDKSNMTFIYNHFSKYSGHFEALCGGVQINPATKKSQLRDTWFKYGFNKDKVRHATPSEIEQFDNDLKSIGKRWNREALEIEELDVSEIVVGWLSACEYLNKPMPKNYVYEPNSDFEKQINAQITLQLICEAWNKFDRFVGDLKNNSIRKYYPVLDINDNINYFYASGTIHLNSALLPFTSGERAIQFGNQFKELFKTAMGIE